MTKTTAAQIEIAYRFPGLSWKHKTFKSQAAFEVWLDKQDSDIEVQFAGE